MILIDSRIGSNDLAAPLAKMGLPAELTHLDFADICFEGKGPNDTTLSIGLELKTLGDLVNSLRSGRLAGHQLPGLLKTYDYVWLLVEGQWRSDDHGLIITYRGKSRGWTPLPGRMSASELEKQVLTLELCGGFHVRYTNSRLDTLRFISSLYHWFGDKPMDAHQSHLAIHTPPAVAALSDFRQDISRWPGIGLKKSLDVEQWFGGSLRRAIGAGAVEWARIPGIGPKIASRLVERFK